MLQTTTRRGDDALISVLLSFYVIWKMPIVAIYTNTYIAMLLLVMMFALLLLKDSDFLNHAPAIFGAAIACMTVTLITDLSLNMGLLNSVWAAFLDLLPMTLGAVMIYKKMDRQIKLLVPILIVVYVITTVTTYNGLQEFPMASRELATGSVDYGPYYARNIGGFNFIYSLVVLHPMFICILWGRRKRVLSIALSVLIGLCIFESKYTMAALTFMVSCIAYFIPMKKDKKDASVRLFLILIFAIVVYVLAPAILNRLAKLEILEASADKLEDIADMLQGEEADFLGTQLRQQAYERSWKTFLASPVWGTRLMSFGFSGGHSYILDTMANWGVIGLGLILYTLRKVAQYYKRITENTTIYYFVMLSLILAVVLSILNSHFWPYELGFIIPIFVYYSINITGKKADDTTDTEDARSVL